MKLQVRTADILFFKLWYVKVINANVTCIIFLLKSSGKIASMCTNNFHETEYTTTSRY